MTGRIKRILRRSRTLVQLRLLYWRVRFHLLRRYAPSWKRAAPDGLPVPPEELRFLITGIKDYAVADFLEMGGRCFRLIQETLRKHGVELRELEAILDFGCGCGRTLRHLAFLKRTRRYGTDYDPALVKWCRPNLAFAEFEVNQLQPPLVYADRTFDLIYAFSVFTHLPEALQHQWFSELTRILKPGGHVALSTMPERLLPADDQERFRNGQLVVIGAAHPGTQFCATFHPYAYMKDVLAPGYEIMEFIPEGVGQDFWLLRKRPESRGDAPIGPV
jgi:SAM-dependent methyltransferase